MKSFIPKIPWKWIGRMALALSAIGMAVAVFIWVRSYFRADALVHQSDRVFVEDEGKSLFLLVSFRGAIGVRYTGSWSKHLFMYQTMLTNAKHKDQNISNWNFQTRPPNSNFLDEFPPGSFGFFHYHTLSESNGQGKRLLVLRIPDWSIAAAIGLPWVVFGALSPLLRKRRIALLLSQQRCVSCGYDLRATPERCPECGTVVTDKAVTSK